MSELNRAIKPWLLANGYKKIKKLPKKVSDDMWKYQYSNGEVYIYFNQQFDCINARCNNGTEHELYSADAEEVIEYLAEHGKAPTEETEKADIPLAQQFSPQQLDIIKTALQEKLARAVQVQIDIEATLKAIEGYSND